VRNLAQVSFILTGSSAKNLLKHILEQDNTSGQLDIASIAKDLGFLAQGGNELEELCKAVIQKLPKEVESIRRGKVNVVMRLVGQVMKDSKGTADARKAKDILLSLIEQSRP
jgi:aspartyl-tRNA(Asn)/glutamyl-tRNA(Gln) amidotransferase subunit B